jgi:cupin fold WbuC family metalloprotein
MSTIQFPPGEIVELAMPAIERLKEAARRSPTRRARFCLHDGPESLAHDMVIAFAAGGYVHPHRHPRKPESYHAIEGEFEVVLFREDGRPCRRIPMGPLSCSGRSFMYRLPPGLWHTVVTTSEMVVLHEVTLGPFLPAETELAPWAPPAENTAAVRTFLEHLMCARP